MKGVESGKWKVGWGVSGGEAGGGQSVQANWSMGKEPVVWWGWG